MGKIDDFELELRKKIIENLGNNFTDNHDEIRFGKKKVSLLESVKLKLFKNYTSNLFIKNSNKRLDKFLDSHGADAAKCYDLLANSQSKNLYLDLICFRLLGKEKVRIFDTRDFIKRRNVYKYVKGNTKKIQIHFNSNSWVLEDYQIQYDNKSLNVITHPISIFDEFVSEQYTYSHDQVKIGAEAGDYCIDAGSCWGDSTLYLSLRTGNSGRVFAFEFIPGNIELMKMNLHLNSHITSNVYLVQNPLWSESGLAVWYKDKGPASKLSFNPIDDASGTTYTLTIDQFVEDEKLEKLDFIKMDIEGAEKYALEGSKNAILKFRPKLAICIYHSLADFTGIAQWIHNLNMGYKFYLKHVSIHAEETILFAY